jgi:hypothetical protein
MGKILIIKGANFSANKIDNVTPTPEPTWDEIPLSVCSGASIGGWNGDLITTGNFKVYSPIDVEGYNLIYNNELTFTGATSGSGVGILFYSAMPTVGKNQSIVTGVQHTDYGITGFSEDYPATIPPGTKYAIFAVYNEYKSITKAIAS